MNRIANYKHFMVNFKKPYKVFIKNGSFSSCKRGSFFQSKPEISNQFLEDTFMVEQLKLDIPEKYLIEIEKDLKEFGEKCATSIYAKSLEIEKTPPKLIRFDAWGNRIDKLIVCEEWKEMKNISAKEGLIAIPYEKNFSVYSRLYQVFKLYLFAPSSGLFSCPLAMTDGAAKTLQNIQNGNELSKEAFNRLTSRDPKFFWTSGQWMTERRGGSDVSNGTESIASKLPNGDYIINGYKWFSSATDADITITLAKIKSDEISKGLTMFLAKVKNNDGTLNGIHIEHLKNKLGTRQLPTAELLLDGMKSSKMSEEGKGISKMSSMLNITRLHNAVASVSNMRRIINLARDYATKRKAFGKNLIEHNLHTATLANMEIECRASFLSICFAAKLLGKIECDQQTNEDQELLRIITPLLKLYTAKQSIKVTSEGLEAFGGQGYIEDTGLPNLLRDSQVLSIWEGTTNILSLDALRSIQKSKGKSLHFLKKYINCICTKALEFEDLQNIANKINNQIEEVVSLVHLNPKILEIAARDFAYSCYRLFTASLIVERCIKSNFKKSDIYLLKRWCNQDLSPILTNNNAGFYLNSSSKENYDIIMNGHPSQQTK